MTAPVLYPTDDDVIEALRQVLNLIWEGAIPVVQGQQNKVSEPKAQNYIVMTPIIRTRLETNVVRQVLGARATTEAVGYSIQCDVHGPNAADNAQMISTLMRDDWAVEAFATVGYPVSPLHADDAKQSAFINGEDQYEDRWSVDVLLQANVTISTTAQYADTLDIGVVEIDASYPPGV